MVSVVHPFSFTSNSKCGDFTFITYKTVQRISIKYILDNY